MQRIKERVNAIEKLESEQQRISKESPLETLARAAQRTMLSDLAKQHVEEFDFEVPFQDFKQEDECAAIARALCPTKSKLLAATSSSRAKAMPKKAAP